MHPNGDELRGAASGAIDVVLGPSGGNERIVAPPTARPARYPKGSWHRLIGRDPGTLGDRHYGRGTRHESMKCDTGYRRTFDPMAIELNHTIVASRDKKAAAKFVTDLLGLSGSTLFGPFEVVELSNGVSLDFMNADEIHPQHYAFLLTEDEFDQVFGRIKEQNLTYWADPMHLEEGEINTRDGGRGVYFDSPDGHYLEILTRPYGSGG